VTHLSVVSPLRPQELVDEMDEQKGGENVQQSSCYRLPYKKFIAVVAAQPLQQDFHMWCCAGKTHEEKTRHVPRHMERYKNGDF
jgi:hypothetical protein